MTDGQGEKVDLKFLVRSAFERVANQNDGRITSLDLVRGELAHMMAGHDGLSDQVLRQALDRLVEHEDKRRTTKGNQIKRPSHQLNLDGLPQWLEEDAMLPDMHGGRFRAATGTIDDWAPVLSEADRQADAANKAREEKYAAFRELGPYLVKKGVTNVKAWLSFVRDHKGEQDTRIAAD